MDGPDDGHAWGRGIVLMGDRHTGEDRRATRRKRKMGDSTKKTGRKKMGDRTKKKGREAKPGPRPRPRAGLEPRPTQKGEHDMWRYHAPSADG